MKRFYLRTVAFCLLFWSVLGCSLDGETGIPLPQYSPELLSVEVVSGTKIDFEFSTPVRRVQISFEPSLEIAAIEEGSTVRVRLEQGLEPGKRVVADIRAEDVHGNTFNESVPLEKALEMEEPPASPPVDDTVGNSAPQLLINELRTESSATRSEFIEFRMLTAGNLDGVRVFIYRSGGGRTPIIFEFPGTEVMADEYVVLHLRTLEGSSADVSPTAHNFWIPGSSSRLNKTSAIYVLDRYDMVLGAVMLSESPDPSWWEGSGRAHFADIAEFLFEQNAWKSPSGGIATPASAVITSSVGTAVTRSISRDELVDNTNTAADWYITANNGATPGMPNDSRRL